MKTTIFTIILTFLIICGNVYGNPAIDALEHELEALRPNLHHGTLKDLKRFDKLREILQSMKQQEENNKIIQEWEESQKNDVCDSLDRNTLEHSECLKVKI